MCHCYSKFKREIINRGHGISGFLYTCEKCGEQSFSDIGEDKLYKLPTEASK